MLKILENLNDSQKEAAKHIDGPQLILAGAGSGKTKTITTRLAYLISLGIDPASILTLTFTNKAASEMRERAYSMIENIAYPPLLCTFHKFGLLFLKFHIDRLGRKNNFVIIDTDDKKKIIKSIEKEISSSLIASEISRYKNNLLDVNDAKNSAQNIMYQKIADVYEKYQNYLGENNLVDFDDLLLLSYQILSSNEDLAQKWSNKYQYIMVDEYQDTNELQYLLLKTLCTTHTNLCVVGDDDQSIYGWRGANIDNILNFASQFENTKTIKLEHNYRSTEKILQVANTLIDHNRERLGKKLVSTRGEGEGVNILESVDENEETKKLCDRISKLIIAGANPKDIAVLFRVNALSRAIEEGLTRNRIRYKLIGGMKFYERAEIKDLIAYFRVITNLNDNFSFKRIINKPKRGLGATTIDKLELVAMDEAISMYGYLVKSTPDELAKVVGKKNARTLKVFVASILDLQEVLQTSKMRFIDLFEESFEFKKYYEAQPDGFDRIANIDEFYGLLRDFFMQNPASNLEDFLNDISLESDQDEIDGTENISLMSVHASKGLEYKHIFVIGLEEGFFPLIGDGSNIEEERRLGYVAFTRAKDTLTVSYVGSRYYKGKRELLTKSRFLVESGLIRGSITIEKTSSYKKGDLVKHKIFGMGRVEGVSKAGKEFKLQINFGGIKRDILASFIEKI